MANGDATPPIPSVPIPPVAPAAPPPPTGAVSRIKDPSGGLYGYRMKDGSIQKLGGDATAPPPSAPPAGAVSRIKDPSGGLYGYRMKDGSIQRGAYTPPAQSGFQYDPATQAKVEGPTSGGWVGQTLDRPTAPGIEVDPIDLATFGAQAAGKEAGQIGATAGQAALKGLETATGFAGYDVGRTAVQPAVQQLKQGGPGSQLAGATLDVASGFVPMLAGAGLGPVEAGAKRLTQVGTAEVREAATEAAAKGAEKATTAQGAIEEARTAADEKLAANMQKFRSKAEDDIAKQAQQEAFGRELGPGRAVAPSEIINRPGVAPTSLPGPEEVSRQQEFRDAVQDTIGRSDKALRDRIKAATPAPKTAVAGTAPPPERPIATTTGVRFKPSATGSPGVVRPLVEADVPKQLQGQFWRFKAGVGNDTLNALVNEQGLSKKTMDHIMGNQQIGLQLADGASTRQKGVLRQAIADYYQNMGGSIDSSHAPILKAAGFGKVLSNPESWAYAERAQDHLADILDNAPAARKTFENRIAQSAQELSEQDSKDFVKAAVKQAKTLPAPVGQRIMATIDAARPEDQGRVALQAFRDMDPQEAGKAQAIEAIQGYKASAVGGFAGYMKRYAMRQAIFGTMGVGLSPHRMIATGGILAAIGTHAALRNAFLNGIREDPEAAYQMIMNPGVERNLGALARNVVQSALPPMATQLEQKALGPTTTGQTPKVGPMAEAIETKQAQQIASETRAIDPGHVDHIAGLHKDIASGKSPNVQRDLNNARLSQGELRKMVEKTPATAGSMFQGMPLADAMEAFQRGTPEEKQMGLAAIAQKINDEGRNLPPLQRRQMMAQLRRALPEEEAGG